MIVAFDVQYSQSDSALVAAVVLDSFDASSPISTYTKEITDIADYESGAFYKRELPCILALLEDIAEPVDTIVIDGYVSLGDHPGLGAHLHKKVDPNIAIIGVAKNYFEGSQAMEVLRGESKKPLYVTSIGIESKSAASKIESMHGEFRIPTLLKLADSLARENPET